MTPLPTSSRSIDVAGVVNDTDSVEGTLSETGDTYTKATPVTAMTTHVITAFEPASTPP